MSSSEECDGAGAEDGAGENGEGEGEEGTKEIKSHPIGVKEEEERVGEIVNPGINNNFIKEFNKITPNDSEEFEKDFILFSEIDFVFVVVK